MSVGAATPVGIVIPHPVGQSQLPLYQFDAGQVRAPFSRLRPFQDEVDLCFSQWRFFHAAAKTELARSFTAARATRHALCFSALNADLFVWDTANLRIRDGGVFSRKDASRTYLAGRFGEAVTYLVMVWLGYKYWDHLPSLVERRMRAVGITHPQQLRIARGVYTRLRRGLPAEQPDFVFENAHGGVALAESKGSFVTPGLSRPPNVKAVLAGALEQLDEWPPFIAPQPDKSYAIGTFFREESDPGPELSLVAAVDPPRPPQSRRVAVNFPDDWIRRGNYGAWLIGMGLEDAGEALRTLRFPKFRGDGVNGVDSTRGVHRWLVSASPTRPSSRSRPSAW